MPWVADQVPALARHSVFPLMFLVLVSMTGCGSAGSFRNENNTLREHNIDLARQVRQLESKLHRYVQEMDAMERRLAAQATGVEGADPPQVNAITFGRYSGAIDTDGDGNDDVLRVYLQVLDQKGRFLPVSGRAVVQAVQISPDRPPHKIIERDYSPDELDRTYRTGITGTHYTLKVKLPSPIPEDLQRASVSVFLVDAASGTTRTFEQTMVIRSSRPRQPKECRIPGEGSP